VVVVVVVIVVVVLLVVVLVVVVPLFIARECRWYQLDDCVKGYGYIGCLCSSETHVEGVDHS